MAQPQATVNIPSTRYIELLEAELKLTKLELLPPVPAAPAKIRGTNCNLHDTTRAIQASGISVRSWAAQHGFSYDSVRQVICGAKVNKAVTAALIDEGFMEA